jgi:hypothetical protein
LAVTCSLREACDDVALNMSTGIDLAIVGEAAFISVSRRLREARLYAREWAERVSQRRFGVSALSKSSLTLRQYDSVR